jgi:hypothetical protein
VAKKYKRTDIASVLFPRLTDERLLELIQLGDTLEQIALRYDLTLGAVINKVRQLGFNKRELDGKPKIKRKKSDTKET